MLLPFRLTSPAASRTVVAALLALVASCGGLERSETSSEVATSGDAALDETAADAAPTDTPAGDPAPPSMTDESTRLATFGAGCYWCVEAVLQQLDGVVSLQSGFMGGHVDDPGYREVCSGTTGHAEVVQVRFDPETISYDALLAWFWKLHDPTTLNRQGADVGTQYRSAIFTHSDEQAAAAKRSLELAQADFAAPIVTEITPASTFWIAKDDHQDYYRNNREQGYCRMVIAPKLDKLGLEH